MELGVIDRMGFNAYFLIVWDFVKWAKDNGIAVGPGRGSAAGSIVAYCLRITDVDPLRYDLLFERFLNPERVSMPDIDIDFSVRGRERVMRYVTEKYGRESVAQIITFGKMFPRAATRDAARVLGHDYGVGDRLAKLIPDPQQGRPPIVRRLPASRASRCAAPTTRTPRRKQIIDVARGLEGIVRNSSIHAAAVVIAGQPLTDIVPLQLADAGGGQRQRRRGARLQARHAVLDEAGRGARPAEDGLPGPAQPRRHRGRAGHHRALDRRAARHDAAPARRREDLRDDGRAATRSACSSSSPRACRARCAQVKPTEFDDLVALVALYRPGAMDQIPAYARGKRNPDAVTVPDERLEPIIGPTYGVILYQEQAMQISKELAGFSGREGRRPAQGDRQEEPRGDGRSSSPSSARAAAQSGTQRAGRRLAVDDEREVRRLLVQRSPRRLLRAHRLPHRLAEGELPGRVHGRADLLGHGHEGQGAVLRRQGGGAWASRSCRPTSTSPTTSSSSSTATSASASTP